MSTLPSRRLPRTGLAVTELGFGAATLGNLYQPLSDADSRDAVRAALDVGMRYVDTAPYYGFGLSERRVGDAIRERDDVVISTKVGRLLEPRPDVRSNAERHGFCSPMPFEPRYDYSYDGIMRSFAASQQRLGLARLDILYVHDIGLLTHRDRHEQTFDELTTGGGFKALEALRSDGAINAFGLGVNEWQICLQAMDHADLDVILLAGRYSLLEQTALDTFLPQCIQRKTSVVIGGPYNSGILATGTKRGGVVHYDYGVAPAEIVDRVRRMEAICERFDVKLPAAALQFPLAHPAVVSVIPGLSSPARVHQTLELYRAAIPNEFWQTLIEEQLLRADAPIPHRTSGP